MNLISKFSDASVDLYNNHPKVYAAVLSASVLGYVVGVNVAAKKLFEEKPNPYHV